MQEEDREYVAKKLGVSDTEFDAIMNLPRKSFSDYPSYGRVIEGPLFKGMYDALRNLYRSILERRNRVAES
jgi:hypothetical protein